MFAYAVLQWIQDEVSSDKHLGLQTVEPCETDERGNLSFTSKIACLTEFVFKKASLVSSFQLRWILSTWNTCLDTCSTAILCYL